MLLKRVFGGIVRYPDDATPPQHPVHLRTLVVAHKSQTDVLPAQRPSRLPIPFNALRYFNPRAG